MANPEKQISTIAAENGLRSCNGPPVSRCDSGPCVDARGWVWRRTRMVYSAWCGCSSDKPVTRLMSRTPSWRALLGSVIVFVLLAACDEANLFRAGQAVPKTAHGRYAQALRDAGLDST